MNPVFDCLDLGTNIGEKTLLKNVSFSLRPGEVLAVLAPNGAGKSTLLRHLSGLSEPQSGKLTLLQKNLFAWSIKDRAQAVASIDQFDDAPLDLAMVTRVFQGLIPQVGAQELLSEKWVAKIRLLCGELSLEHALNQHLGSLSGGERKRVHLARALIQESAALYILDEPFASLDVKNREIVGLAIQKRAQMGKSFILSAHSPEECRFLGPTAKVLLLDGQHQIPST